MDIRTQRSSLYHLPSQIHHGIFAHLPDIQDVLSLSLANRYFWAVGLLHIEDHIVGSLAPWAGERIICISDHSDARDIPATVLSASESAEVTGLNRTHELQAFSTEKAWKQVGGPSLSQRLQKWFEEYEAANPMCEADRAEVMMGLKPEILEFYPRDQEWVLRNLTVKEVIRGGVIALKEEFIHGPQIDVLGFAEVLLLRISWSSEPVRSGKSGDIARGKWAGHRFDITPLAIHNERGDVEEWKDVSDEVFREIDVILSGQKGDDWREQLTGQHSITTVPMFMGYS